MYTITVKSVVQDTVSYEAGAVLASKIHRFLISGEQVALALDDLNGLSTSFMHGAFGQLIDEFGIGVVKKRLVFKNLSGFMQQQLQDYFTKYTETATPS